MIEDPEIDWLRGQIDAIDHQLLALIHQRLDVVLRVGDKKREKGFAVYDPAREAKMLDGLAQEAQAPLDAEAVRQVFSTLIAHCRRIESQHMER